LVDDGDGDQFPKQGAIGVLEQLGRGRVRVHHSPVETHDGAAGAVTGAQESVEEHAVSNRRTALQLTFDVASRLLGHGEHQRLRMLGRARQIDRPTTKSAADRGSARLRATARERLAKCSPRRRTTVRALERNRRCKADAPPPRTGTRAPT
jgi:hypothetical protein